MDGRRSINAVSIFAVALVAIGALNGCTTSYKDGDPDGMERTHYTLQVGEAVPHPSPLPVETPIFVKWHLKNGGATTIEGFRAWDFNRDGRFEMVEVLNEDGSMQARVFDFDGDGTIDETRNQLAKTK